MCCKMIIGVLDWKCKTAVVMFSFNLLRSNQEEFRNNNVITQNTSKSLIELEVLFFNLS